MSGDEAVRKEFERWYESQDARYRNGYLAETIFAAGYAIGRSAAIQECADVLNKQADELDSVSLPMRADALRIEAKALLALKERG